MSLIMHVEMELLKANLGGFLGTVEISGFVNWHTEKKELACLKP